MFKHFLGNNVPEKSLVRFTLASDGLSGSDIREVSALALRTSLIEQREQVQEGDVLKRLLLRKVDQEQLSIPELITRAKELLPGVYTHRVLAEMFEMTPGNVTHILHRTQKEKANGR